MRATRTCTAIAGTTLALALTGCGADEVVTTQPAREDASVGASPPRDEASAGEGERITAGGIAAVVLEHLGHRAVRQFVTFEPEPGSVAVMVRMRDSTPHNFVVQVYSPVQAEMYGEAGTCPDERRTDGEFRCRTLENGTTVTAWEDAHGFSDDNADGVVVSGSTITPENGGALAMYESYDDSPAVSLADLEDLLTDQRLTWLTDPAVNDAGADVDVRKLDG